MRRPVLPSPIARPSHNINTAPDHRTSAKYYAALRRIAKSKEAHKKCYIKVSLNRPKQLSLSQHTHP